MNKLLKTFAFRSYYPIIETIEFGVYRDLFIVQLTDPKTINMLKEVEEIKRILDLRHERLYALDVVSRRQFAKKLAKLLMANNIKIIQAYLNITCIK